MSIDLELLLRDLESAYGISLTVHDDLGCLTGKGGGAWLPGRNLHQHPYCAWNRCRREFNRRCVEHCHIGMNARLRHREEPLETFCWKGVSEVVVPIWRGGRKCLTLFAGGFRREGEACPLPGVKAEALYGTLRQFQPGERERLIRLLTVTGQGMLAAADREVPAAEGDRRTWIEQCIYRNAHQPDFDLGTLARQLSLSPSRAGHLVREVCGVSFGELLAAERLRRVRNLLSSSDLPLAEIAEAAGLSGSRNLCRLFRRHEGMTPGDYRKRIEKE